MADGREERDEREQRVEREKKESKDDRISTNDPDQWEPERQDS